MEHWGLVAKDSGRIGEVTSVSGDLLCGLAAVAVTSSALAGREADWMVGSCCDGMITLRDSVSREEIEKCQCG